MSTRSRAELPKPTDRLPLGASGLEVSPICVGMTDDPRTIPAAFEAGINFFFVTADMHWPLYEPTRRGLAQLLDRHPGARDQIVVGVVSYVAQPEFLWAPFEEVLDELPQLGRLDLTIAGGAYGHEIDQRLTTYARHRTIGHAGPVARRVHHASQRATGGRAGDGAAPPAPRNSADASPATSAFGRRTGLDRSFRPSSVSDI